MAARVYGTARARVTRCARGPAGRYHRHQPERHDAGAADHDRERALGGLERRRDDRVRERGGGLLERAGRAPRGTPPARRRRRPAGTRRCSESAAAGLRAAIGAEPEQDHGEADQHRRRDVAGIGGAAQRLELAMPRRARSGAPGAARSRRPAAPSAPPATAAAAPASSTTSPWALTCSPGSPRATASSAVAAERFRRAHATCTSGRCIAVATATRSCSCWRGRDLGRHLLEDRVGDRRRHRRVVRHGHRALLPAGLVEQRPAGPHGRRREHRRQRRRGTAGRRRGRGACSLTLEAERARYSTRPSGGLHRQPRDDPRLHAAGDVRAARPADPGERVRRPRRSGCRTGR